MIQALRLPPSMLRMAELDTGKTMASSPELNPSADSLRISATSSSDSLRRLSVARPAVASRNAWRLISFSKATRSFAAALARLASWRRNLQFSLNTSRPRFSASAGLARWAAQCFRESFVCPSYTSPVVTSICAPQPARAQIARQVSIPLGVPSLRVYGAVERSVNTVPVLPVICSPRVKSFMSRILEAYGGDPIKSTIVVWCFIEKLLQLLQHRFIGASGAARLLVAQTCNVMHVLCFNCFNLLQMELLKQIKRARFNCSTLGVVGPSEKGLPLLEQTGLPGAWSRSKAENRLFCFNCFNWLEKGPGPASASNGLKHAKFCALDKRAENYGAVA